ncbi:hypothetical protein K0M31_019711 [Melipona bicolor]|uniref:Uncharacterized protein n=1 Tax=Melipona bicolor TaxID=60889 RepID=A0AA40G2Y3_9HYME|nr:hypothetical protein K0M31_019711 [Melipona bicolor]
MEQHSLIEKKNIKNQVLFNATETLKSHAQNLEQKQTNKLNFKSLRDRNKKDNAELQPNISHPPKNKLRAVVDLKMMTEELKQLEDPPLTPWEKETCSNRLPYSFFDCPCEELAQNLLGNITNYLVLLFIHCVSYKYTTIIYTYIFRKDTSSLSRKWYYSKRKNC